MVSFCHKILTRNQEAPDLVVPGGERVVHPAAPHEEPPLVVVVHVRQRPEAVRPQAQPVQLRARNAVVADEPAGRRERHQHRHQRDHKHPDAAISGQRATLHHGNFTARGKGEKIEVMLRWRCSHKFGGHCWFAVAVAQFAKVSSCFVCAFFQFYCQFFAKRGNFIATSLSLPKGTLFIGEPSKRDDTCLAYFLRDFFLFELHSRTCCFIKPHLKTFLIAHFNANSTAAREANDTFSGTSAWFWQVVGTVEETRLAAGYVGKLILTEGNRCDGFFIERMISNRLARTCIMFDTVFTTC